MLHFSALHIFRVWKPASLIVGARQHNSIDSDRRYCMFYCIVCQINMSQALGGKRYTYTRIWSMNLSINPSIHTIHMYILFESEMLPRRRNRSLTRTQGERRSRASSASRSRNGTLPTKKAYELIYTIDGLRTWNSAKSDKTRSSEIEKSMEWLRQ